VNHRFFVFPLLTLTACINYSASADPQPADSATPLGRVTVAYAATSDGDVVTARDPKTGIDASSLHIARDATFLLAPRTAGFTLAAADDATFVLAADGHARSLSRGSVGVLVVAADDNVYDFVDLQVADVASVTIEPSGPLTAAPGDINVLAARPTDASAIPLAGSITWTWESSDPAVVSVAPTSNEPGSRVRATALRAGTSTVVVRGAGVEASVTMEVTL